MPTIPSGSSSKFFGIKVSKDGIPVSRASDKQLIYKDDFSTKTFYDTVNSRMLEGLLPDGSYGIWVSSTGVNVTTADPNAPGQLVFNSNQDIFRVVSTIIKSHNVNNVGPIGAQYAHGLSFVPSFLAYTSSNDPADGTKNYFATGASPLGASSWGVATSVDATYVYVSWIGTTVTTYQASIKIYLFQESIATS